MIVGDLRQLLRIKSYKMFRVDMTVDIRACLEALWAEGSAATRPWGFTAEDEAAAEKEGEESDRMNALYIEGKISQRVWMAYVSRPWDDFGRMPAT